ncbi:MAG: exo-alpha-sialidase [Planctomycetota bacterium]|nr:MAG: exo-alpha-sialidase [Planctomycetota bacterium]
MSSQILVATRKGLLTVHAGANGNWQAKKMHFLGQPVSFVLAHPDGPWYAALDLGHFGAKLHRSEDQGENWEELPAPAFPEQDPATSEAEKEAKEEAPSVEKIWCLTPGPGEELWAGCIPAGLFHSNDGGRSWTWKRSLWDVPERQEWFGGGYDHAGIHSILVDPRNSAHLLVAISVGGVWQSLDSGTSFQLIGQGMRAAYVPPERSQDPAIQDPHCVVRSPQDPDRLWMQHHNGIFHSRDNGQHWTESEDVRPSNFGFAVAVDPNNSERAWFVPAMLDECRIPVDGRLVVNRTSDGGTSFETLNGGLPDQFAYDLVYRHALDISQDGRFLAFGSTTGGLWLSDDGGEHWTTVHQNLPPIYALRFVP